MLVLASREGARVEFKPSPASKIPRKVLWQSWFSIFGSRAGVEFNPPAPPGNKNQEPRLPQNFSGNLDSWI